MSWYSSANQQQQTPKRGPGLHHAITNAVTNAGLIRITCTAHTFSTSNRVDVTGVLGVPNANGQWTITVIDANTFDLQGSVFAGAYTSGGQASLV
jgi:hypothetical protein